MTSDSGARLGLLGACVLALGTAFACTVEENLPIGDWTGGSGGSAGSDGSVHAGGSVNAGTGAGPTTAGSAGSGGTVESLSVGCDYVTVLNRSCARSACHNERSAVADFNLTPTSPDGSPEGLIARLKDQPARHREIDCGNGDPYMECVPATCPPPGTALYVDSANPDESWILKKLHGTHDECGLQMPLAPGSDSFDATAKACLEELVYAVAAIGQSSAPRCYSPTSLPDPSASADQVGCPCSGSDAFCVVAANGHQFGLVCDGERWLSVEDGPCQPAPVEASSCQVKGPHFTQIVAPGEPVTSPFYACSTCTCSENGRLLECSEPTCPERDCPSGTARGERCLACGPTGACQTLETGCLPRCTSDDACDLGTCNALGFCSVDSCN